MKQKIKKIRQFFEHDLVDKYPKKTEKYLKIGIYSIGSILAILFFVNLWVKL